MPKHLLFNTNTFKEYFLETEDKSIEYLPYVNFINIIIGSNNSGKSRFLRALLLISQAIYVDLVKFKEYHTIAEQYNTRIRKTKFQGISDLPLNFSTIETYLAGNTTNLDNNPDPFLRAYKQDFRVIKEQVINSLKDISRLYIPTLRSAHALFQGTEKVAHDIYSDTIKINHKLEGKGLKIFTGLHLYKEILRSRNSDKKTRELFEKFEDFLGKSFFDGKKVDIVAKFDLDERTAGKSDSELILIHIEGDSETYKLYELGDGIQAIIILMYQIFMAEPDSFIYIDEPELHLHPGMQRLFLEQLCYNEDLKKKNLTYFITTHSNHFLDLTIEKDNVSIYAFSPRTTDSGQKQFVIKNVNAGDNDILKHLGVNNSSVFMANCSIWVEGVSDRNYIKAFLKAYTYHLREMDDKDSKSIKEDIDYAFFEYAGSNIDHYFFGDLNEDQEEEVVSNINALALHNKILLMADSDNATGAKRKRLDELKAAKGGNFVPVVMEEIKEVENLLTNEIWDAVLIEFCNKKRVEVDKAGIQAKISLAIEKFDYKVHEKDSIGTFLNMIDLEIGDNILNKIYETKADGTFGTFIQKRELSEIVLKKEFNWEVFSKNPELEKLTKAIYQFIISSKN